MIAVIALAVGVLAGAPDAPQPIKDEPCYRPHLIPSTVKPKAKHPGTVVHKPRPRLFKTEPKPAEAEEPCGEAVLPPPLTVLPPEPVYGFSPVPFAELVIEPPDLPVPDLPPVEDRPCACDGEGAGFPGFGTPGPGLVFYRLPDVGHVPAVPEPEPALLILLGLGAAAWWKGRARA